jgi:beta-glucosidase-like glycosyl hydrolase
MATRILASWYFLGQDSGYPSVSGWTSWNGGTGGPNVQGTHKTIARSIARDGIVLLKNENNALPLNKPKSLAIIGQDAIVNPSGANACTDRDCDTGTLAMVCFFLVFVTCEGSMRANERARDGDQEHVNSRTLRLHTTRSRLKQQLMEQRSRFRIRILPLQVHRLQVPRRLPLSSLIRIQGRGILLSREPQVTVSTLTLGTAVTLSSLPSQPSTKTPLW